MATDQVESDARAQPNLPCLDSGVAAVDLSVLTQFEDAQLEGMPDIVVELIDLYLGDAPLRMLALNDAQLRQDADGIRRAAHCLRGSSGTLGAQGIVLLCDEIEHLEVREMFSKMQELLTNLSREFERVRLSFVAERRKRLSSKS